MYLLITYHLLLGLVTAGSALTEDHKYCVSDSPLYTPYFIPFYKTVQPALGCVSRPSTLDKTEVHVVRLAQPAKDVFIYVTGSSNQTDLSLVLASPSPVTWHLSMSGYSHSPNILISDGSRVINTATGAELETTAAILRTDSITHKLAITQFTTVHTFTSVTAANRIFIKMLPELASQSPCDIADRQQSSAVEAFFVQRQNTFGCYHQEAAGLLPNDVHVIDLKEKVVKRSTAASDIIEDVVLEVSPDKTEVQDEALLPRNLTLILKSDKPVKWVIKSKGIKGQLIIAAGDNKVESVSDNSEQRLDIREHADIPDSFDSLIREVTSNYGLPLSYIRVHQANLLEMVIPPRSKRELSSLLDFGPEPSEGQTHVIDLEKDSDVAAEQIEKAMIKECNEEHKSISVKIPVDVVTKYGIGSMSLNDPNCLPEKSDSYWSLTSHSTRCGSLALTYGASPMYRNNVNIRFDKGSLAGQTTKVPFICKFKPGIPGFPTPPEYFDDYEDSEPDPGQVSSEAGEMYSLKVELASEDGDKKATLLNLKSDSATAAVGDNIIVSSHIDAVPYLALAMEQCWISNSSKVSTHASASDQLMITSGCPTSSQISLHWQKGTANSAFAFKITKELIAHKKVWIQCRMGLCSATAAGAKGNIKRCIDPEYDCAANHQHRESSLQQISIRGPLHIVPVARNDLETPIDKEPLSGDNEDLGFATKTSHTLVEVPVEVAVAIALASFIVGAMSTGVLWFLHSKAMQAKTRRFNCQGTELQSMLRPSVGQVASTGSLHHRSQDGAGSHSHGDNSVQDGDMNANCTVCPLI